MHISRLLRAAAVAMLLATLPATSSAALFIGVSIAPPALPIYTQPPAPFPNFMWQPGYWAWGPGGYFWVPGTWVAAPAIGMLWTPGYWGWNNNAYWWHPGFWGRTVGFYGGINYGFGYFGSGFVGGNWRGGQFRYNTAIMNVNRTTIHNTFVDRTVVYRNTPNRTSFNGGHGGINAGPTHDEMVARQHGVAPTTEQTNHEQISSQNRYHLSTVNHGQPTNGAVQHPYSHSNPPQHFTPVTESDKQAAQQHQVPARTNNRPPR